MMDTAAPEQERRTQLRKSSRALCENVAATEVQCDRRSPIPPIPTDVVSVEEWVSTTCAARAILGRGLLARRTWCYSCMSALCSLLICGSRAPDGFERERERDSEREKGSVRCLRSSDTKNCLYSTTPRNGNQPNGNHLDQSLSSPQKNGN